MKLKQFVAGVAPALAAVGFREVRPHPSYAPRSHVVFVSVEPGDVLCIEFQPMRMPGRLDFMVRLRAATANWIRFWPSRRPDGEEAPAEAYAHLWMHTLKLLPGFEGLGDEVWAVTEGADVAALQAALAHELATVTVPGMRAELRHHHAIETAIQRGDDETARLLIARPITTITKSWSRWYGGLDGTHGYADWLRVHPMP